MDPDSTVPLGKFWNDPGEPLNFLPRPEELQGLKAKVLADDRSAVAVTGAARRTGVQGMGGLGKSVLAAALGRDEEVRRSFPDGVFWVPLGQTLSLTTWQVALAKAVGVEQPSFNEVQQGKLCLREALAEKTCLLILDDVWQQEHAEAFDVLGASGQMLLTTRIGGLVTTLGAIAHPLEALSDQQALALLADWAKQPIETLPEAAHQVRQECGNLPLALAMVGAMAQGKPNCWENLLHKLRNAELEKIQFPGSADATLLKAIQVSLEALEPELQQRYLDFAVFPEDTAIPEAVLQVFWSLEGLDEYDTQDLLDQLVDRSLIQRDEQGNFSLHDLQVDYVRKQVKDLPGLHDRLLRAYAAQYPAGWHTVSPQMSISTSIWQSICKRQSA